MNNFLSSRGFAKTVIGEYAEALIWAVALALVLTTFVVQAFKIPSGSMLETLQNRPITCWSTNSSTAFGILSMTTT